MLSKSKMTDSDLRLSVFRAERFGCERNMAVLFCIDFFDTGFYHTQLLRVNLR